MRTKLGDVCADCGPRSDGKGRRYVKLGVAFIDSEDQRISLKIDCLPIPGDGWGGWINIFQSGRDNTSARGNSAPPDDDIPF